MDRYNPGKYALTLQVAITIDAMYMYIALDNLHSYARVIAQRNSLDAYHSQMRQHDAVERKLCAAGLLALLLSRVSSACHQIPAGHAPLHRWNGARLL